MKHNNKKKTEKNRFPFVWLMVALILLAAVAAIVIKASPRFGYQKKYTEYVEKACLDHGLDENLVYAVIRTESHFTPDAVSRTGAVGLMQLMPSTAEWIAWRRGIDYDREMLFEPEYNIDNGCWLLKYLIDYYGGNLEYALAAYNAGSGNVDSWLASDEYFDGKELDIPFPETADYVKKTLKAYEKYKYSK